MPGNQTADHITKLGKPERDLSIPSKIGQIPTPDLAKCSANFAMEDRTISAALKMELKTSIFIQRL